MMHLSSFYFLSLGDIFRGGILYLIGDSGCCVYSGLGIYYKFGKCLVTLIFFFFTYFGSKTLQGEET
jgi:hypothetical protein